MSCPIPPHHRELAPLTKEDEYLNSDDFYEINHWKKYNIKNKNLYFKLLLIISSLLLSLSAFLGFKIYINDTLRRKEARFRIYSTLTAILIGVGAMIAIHQIILLILDMFITPPVTRIGKRAHHNFNFFSVCVVLLIFIAGGIIISQMYHSIGDKNEIKIEEAREFSYIIAGVGIGFVLSLCVKALTEASGNVGKEYIGLLFLLLFVIAANIFVFLTTVGIKSTTPARRNYELPLSGMAMSINIILGVLAFYILFR